MRINIIVGLLFFLILPNCGAVAQKIQKHKTTNEIFIDCRDMPWAIETSLKKVGNGSDKESNGVFRRLQIASDDCRSDGTKKSTSSTGTATMAWSVALGLDASYDSAVALGQLQGKNSTGCAAYWENSISEKGSWRVPTQREIQLIWIMASGGTKGVFDGPLSKFVSNFTSNLYLSSSELSATKCWYTVFNIKANGGDTTTSVNKDASFSVRCVREVN